MKSTNLQMGQHKILGLKQLKLKQLKPHYRVIIVITVKLFEPGTSCGF